jgi:hypothetical protein
LCRKCQKCWCRQSAPFTRMRMQAKIQRSRRRQTSQKAPFEGFKMRRS